VVSGAVAAAAATLWLLVGVKFAGTIRSGSSPARWLLATFAFLALGITIFIPAVEQRLTAAAPVEQIKEPLARTAIIAAAFCAQTLLSLTGDPISWARRRLRWGICAAALGVLWVTFALGPASPSAQFGSHPVHDVSMTLFILAFLTYLAYAVATVMTGCWRYAHPASGVMQWGLRLISVGCAASLAYVVVKLMAIVGFAAGIPIPPEAEGAAAKALVAVGALLVAVGSAATATSQRASELRKWRRDYVAHRRLYPLWADLVGAVPTVALDPAAGQWQDASRIRDLHLRLYRRLIELRDAWLALRPFMDDDLAKAVTPVSGQLDVAGLAALEAVMLRAGIEALPVQQPATRPWTADSASGGSMAEELGWWLAVAQAWSADREFALAAPRSADVRPR